MALIPHVHIIHGVMTLQPSIIAPKTALSIRSLPFWFDFVRTVRIHHLYYRLFTEMWNLKCSLSSLSPRSTNMLNADMEAVFFMWRQKTRRQQQWKSVRKISQQLWLKKYLLNDARSYSNIYQSFKLLSRCVRRHSNVREKDGQIEFSSATQMKEKKKSFWD